jgi:NAD(P)-dependent dehydrogenase (short-subunit alcohol dehydrogenase family)
LPLFQNGDYQNKDGKAMKKLEGKIALITGGTSGIGMGTAKRFASEGAYVYITGRREAELDAAVREIGENSRGIQGDVTNLEDLDRLFAVIKEEKGTLDVVFANAGWGEFAALGSITEEHFDKTFDINVKGVVFTVQKALPLLKDGSAIVINASMVSVLGQPAFSIYSATKAAVRSFARNWSVDLKDRKIRVNVVSPRIRSDGGLRLSRHQRRNARIGNRKRAFGSRGNARRHRQSRRFLASEDSSYITGIELFVDGGAAQI